MIIVKDLHKSFEDNQVLKGVNYHIHPGEKIVVVGPSGSGKSTFLRCLNLLERPTSGEIWFDGQNITDPRIDINKVRQHMGMVFQHFNLFNNLTIMNNITLAPVKLKLMGEEEAKENALKLLKRVGLEEKADAYPASLSGGQKQRIGIARALALNPQFIVCDEPVSALDVSIQAQILNLMDELQEKMGLTYMFITHDLSVVHYFADDIAVMYLGRRIEKAPAKELFRNPVHPYTQALLSAIPVPSIHNQRKRILLKGEITSPVDPKPGCRFASRCPYASSRCHSEEPQLKEIAPGHFNACFLNE